MYQLARYVSVRLLIFLLPKYLAGVSLDSCIYILYTKDCLNSQKHASYSIYYRSVAIVNNNVQIIYLVIDEQAQQLYKSLLVAVKYLVRHNNISKRQYLTKAYNKVEVQYRKARGVDLVGTVVDKGIRILLVYLYTLRVYKEQTAEPSILICLRDSKELFISKLVKDTINRRLSINYIVAEPSEFVVYISQNRYCYCTIKASFSNKLYLCKSTSNCRRSSTRTTVEQEVTEALTSLLATVEQQSNQYYTTVVMLCLLTI